MRDALRRLRWWLIIRLAGQDTVVLNAELNFGGMVVRRPGLLHNLSVTGAHQGVTYVYGDGDA